ncbi:uncharacterized protein F4817DRAFT_314486 [Daldinia loculata]|uniref:uncharacterized protein n=1 Tax=Daldinia loculata TaxID=103429 RepID=UPI0020C242CF|nr:uncharacterized protein F4817DRAFT_314486 [Daldinia loculata]KAI1648850.1 hypothetical protein F4817DRAFT_314486 [Daldinia loculata]
MTSPNQTSRGYESRHVSRIIVEPTPENQRIYNDIRQTLERLRLQTHVVSQQNLLPPQAAPSIGSTIHSPTDEPGTPSTQDVTTQDADRSRRQRGRRRGPLNSRTRLNTALKRKLKLACPHHRAKKTTCDCHDFCLLEEGYQNTLLSQSPSHGRLHGRTEFMSLTPIERTWNTFGAGGAAMASSEQDSILNDIDLQSSVGDHEAVRSDVQQIVSGFDADSVHLDSTMLQAPGQTYHPGNDMGTQSPDGHIQLEFLEIGSQMEMYPNRWRCEYRGSIDTASETSSETCHWTGPFRELSNHFRTKHHPFHDVNPRFWLVCTRCRARARAPNDLESPLSPFRCTRESCLGSSCQRWYYGSTRDESVAGSAVALTQSSESEAGYSWSFQPEGNQPWLGGGASNNGYGSHFGARNPHEHPYYHSAKWETSSDSSTPLTDCGNPPRKPLRPVRKYYTRCKSPRQCPIRLLSFAKLPISHLLSIIVPLLTTIIRESSHFTVSDPLQPRAINTDAFSWWSLILVLIGFVATWSLKDRARSRVFNEPIHRDHRRQHRRGQFPSDEGFIIRHHFNTLMTA